MESPIYFLFTLNERKQMITEFCLLYGTKWVSEFILKLTFLKSSQDDTSYSRLTGMQLVNDKRHGIFSNIYFQVPTGFSRVALPAAFLQHILFGYLKKSSGRRQTVHIAFLVNLATGFIPNCVVHICNHLLVCSERTSHFPHLNICYGGKYEKKSNKWTLFSICCGLISG